MSPAFVNAPVALTGSRAAPCVTSAFTGARPAVRVARVSRATVRASDGEIEEELSWVDAIAVDEITVGALHRRVVVGLDLVFVCDNDGQVYVLGNKGTPLGTPLTGGSIFTDELGVSYLKCPQYGTLYDLRTGDVKDQANWVPKPFPVSKLLQLIFKVPDGIPAYEVRENAGMMQVLVNVNARAQYEKKYWKGILDASGKADGGYY